MENKVLEIKYLFTIMFRKLFLLILLSVSLNSTGLSVPGNTGTKGNPAKHHPLMILAIGDSNGALPDGWVNQLRKIMPADSIYNTSISGNTIGFNNQGRKSLNTLANITGYMDKAYSQMGKIDIVVIMLGTNDCKAVFKDSLSFVPGNMNMLISKIRLSGRQHKNNPLIFIVSPPPFGPDELIGEKYSGGMERVTRLNDNLKKIADNMDTGFIDTFHILLPVFKNLTSDGVHLNADGQMIIARVMLENLKYYSDDKTALRF